MRILLTANASYVPPRGGATRSNLVWLRHLASAGHSCVVVSAGLGGSHAGRAEQMEAEQSGTEWKAGLRADGVETFERPNLLVLAASDRRRQLELLATQVRDFSPDWVLVSSEDVGHALLSEASRVAPGRVVYLAHTPQFFPFGPESWNLDARAAALLSRTGGIVVIGRHMAAYVRRHTGREAVVIHPPVYGAGPYPELARAASGLVVLVNPCAVKGLSIFLGLADRFPDVPFGALPGWGTTSEDRRQLEQRPNISILPNCRDIRQVLGRTRLLLMPSLWYEGFGLTAMEAMLHGIPVISSDSGGLVEAKQGTGYVIPVRPIERYEPVFDERGMPRPVIRETDIEPWARALAELLGDRRAYERESEASRRSALGFVSSLNAARMEEYLVSLRTPRMRILLAQNALYFPSLGGGDKSNRILMEALAAAGHTCRVVSRIPAPGAAEEQEYLRELETRGVGAGPDEEGAVRFERNGVDVRVVTSTPNLRGYFSAQAASFAPDVILASTDDPAQVLLEAALKSAAKVVYLARATLAVPFGPDCAFPSDAKTRTLRLVDGAVGVSEYVAGYLSRYGGLDSVHVPISLMERGPAPLLGRFQNEFVTMVNPCAVKGISIFLALADRFPSTPFAAVTGWGTTEADVRALAARPNIALLARADDFDAILARTRVLLVPSLWAEARSRVVVEAMHRGIPVMAADAGGIGEAKLGVPYLLPVRLIERYQARLDEQMVPVAEVPEQDISPWAEALARLLDDRRHWEEISSASREAAGRYVAGLSIGPFEAILAAVLRAPAKDRTLTLPEKRAGTLSPEKRALLAARLRKSKAAQGRWLPPSVEDRGRTRLFCFPYAGGGASAFARWQERLPDLNVCPVLAPGRERRSGEPALESMEPMAEAVTGAIQPFAAEPFAFFGHSMGAAVAFEVARRLRRKGLPLPAVLIVSGARAPQFRRDYVPPPDPSPQEFLAELRRLEGVPAAVLDNPELLALVLPALSADSRLYRRYVYSDEPPLACPIRAYGGLADPNVRRDHLEAWGEQTTGGFRLRMFAGGHFYLAAALDEVVAVIGADAAPGPADRP